MDDTVRFWGVRGTVACPLPTHMRYGGNTSCVELTLGGATIILDAGTGLRALGKDLLARGTRRATLLLTHTHWDHINGFPFFAPAFEHGFGLDVLAGHMDGRTGGIRAVLAQQMEDPTFPVPLSAMRAQVRFVDFQAGTTLDLGGGVTAATLALRHPNGATGYRIMHGGRAVCYVTDTEHEPDQPDAGILSLIRDADLVIYDSTYTDAEFPAHRGWGHSTWQEGVRLCQKAGARRLALFHHDPDHDDACMDDIADAAARRWPGGTLVAREGSCIVLGTDPRANP